MGITLEQAKQLTYGTTLYHKVLVNNDQSPMRFRVSGMPKTLKRTPSYVQVPVKHGLYDNAYLINSECPKHVAGKWLITIQEVELKEELAK